MTDAAETISKAKENVGKAAENMGKAVDDKIKVLSNKFKEWRCTAYFPIDYIFYLLVFSPSFGIPCVYRMLQEDRWSPTIYFDFCLHGDF